MISKGLRLAMVAIAAMLLHAVFASAAFAEGEFEGEGGVLTYLHDVQVTENVITFNNRAMKCKTVTWTGQMENGHAVKTEYTPKYEGCTAFAGIAATVAMNGCEFDLTVKTKTTGDFQITCPAGKKIVVKAGECTLEIGAQGPVNGGVDFKNEGAGKTADILITATMTEMVGFVTGPLALCGTNGERTNGVYTGTLTEKAFKNAGLTEQIGLQIN